MFKRLLKQGLMLLALAFVLVIGTMSDVKAATGAATAQPIAVNTQYTICRADDEAPRDAWYTFQAPADGYFTVSAGIEIGGDDDIKVIVYDSNNNELFNRWESSWATYEITSRAGEIFYIYIGDLNTGVNHYVTVNYYGDPNWEIEDNSSAAMANTIANNVTRYGTINNKDEADYYKFQVKGLTKAKITLGPKDVTGNSASYNVEIWNSANEHSNLIGWVSNIQSTDIYLQKGTYYLKVTGTRNCPYQIKCSTKGYSVPKPAIKQVKLGKTYKSWFGKKKMRYMGDIKLKKAYDVVGYTLQMAKKKNMTGKEHNQDRDVTTSSYDDTKLTIRRLKNSSFERKTYYFRVRGYVKDAFGETVYGKWGSVYKKAF